MDETITVTSTSESLKVIPTANVQVAEFSGSVLLKQFKVRAISFTEAPFLQAIEPVI
jgi:hypothetical protein